MKKIIWKNIALCAVGFAVMIAVWLIAHLAVGNEFLVPNFFLSIKAVFALFANALFWKAIAHTLFRVLIAFAISFVFAVIFALIAYLYPSFHKIIAPMVGVLRALPVLGVLLVILVWTNASVAPIVVAFLSLFPLLYAEIFASLSGVDADLIEMSRVYKVPLKTQIRKLYLPSVLPHIVQSSGAALGFGVKLVVSAEVLSRAKNSLGNLLQESEILSNMPTLFALLIVACILAFVLESAFAVLSARMQRRAK